MFCPLLWVDFCNRPFSFFSHFCPFFQCRPLPTNRPSFCTTPSSYPWFPPPRRWSLKFSLPPPLLVSSNPLFVGVASPPSFYFLPLATGNSQNPSHAFRVLYPSLPFLRQKLFECNFLSPQALSEKHQGLRSPILFLRSQQSLLFIFTGKIIKN